MDEPSCFFCGCTEDRACPGGCSWVPNGLMLDICSACAPRVTAEGHLVVRVASLGEPDGTPGEAELRRHEHRRDHLVKVVYLGSRTAAWIAKNRVVTQGGLNRVH